jgi:3-deoxy-D-manno-octulosonic-acid transferase
MFARLSDVCAQDAAYAERFRALGARPEAVSVTGTMKFDTAEVADRIDGDADLARAVGLRPGTVGPRRGDEPVWVCGSTGPGEEQVVSTPTAPCSPPTPRCGWRSSPGTPSGSTRWRP